MLAAKGNLGRVSCNNNVSGKKIPKAIINPKVENGKSGMRPSFREIYRSSVL